MNWRELERQRRLKHPEIRGVAWRCEHGPHDSTATRGPLRRTQAHKHMFVINREQKREYGGLWGSDTESAPRFDAA